VVDGFPLLSSIILVPLIGAFVMLFLPKDRPELARLIGPAFSVITGALAVYLLISFDPNSPDLFQFQTKTVWIEDLGISWHLGGDGITVMLVLLAGVLFPLSLLGVLPEHRDKAYFGWFLFLEAAVMGTFMALDMFLFFVCFEVSLVPLYFLIAEWGHGEKVKAATKFFLYTSIGSIFMLVSMVATAVLFQKESGGPLTFDLVTIATESDFAQSTGRWLFAGFAIAFAVKAALFPLHTWLPDAHGNAPTAGSVDLAAIMLKLGTFGFFRFGLLLFPEASVWAGPFFVTIGVIGVLYGAICAAMQKNLKRVIAYSSVAHLGFIIIGTFALTTESLSGSVLQMVNHGVSSGALFMLVGYLYERRHTYEIAGLKGLQKPAPIFAAVFTLVMLSSIGVPGLNGFVGEFLILIGSFLTYRWWVVVATAGVILAAVYMLWSYQRVFHGVPDEPNAKIPDLNVREKLTMLVFVAIIVGMGIFPKPFLERIEPSVKQLIEHVERKSDYRQPVPGEQVAEEAGG
jgi:NADH-quinone oxidoreductase subunit M